MIRKIFILLLVLSYFTSLSQKFEMGTITTVKGDSFDAQIKTFNTTQNIFSSKNSKDGIILSEGKLKYQKNGSTEKIKTSQIKSIKIGDRTYRTISYDIEVTTGPSRGRIKTLTKLAEITVDGDVQLCVVHSYEPGFGVGGTTGVGLAPTSSYSYVTRKYLVTNDEKVSRIERAYFKTDIKKVFKNCTELDQKLDGMKVKDDES